MGEEALRLDEAERRPSGTGRGSQPAGRGGADRGAREEGLALLRRSYDLRAAALGEDDEETIESLNNVGVALWRSGAQDEAIATHEDALRRCERTLGEAHRRTAETLNALAVKLQSLPESGEQSAGSSTSGA